MSIDSNVCLKCQLSINDLTTLHISRNKANDSQTREARLLSKCEIRKICRRTFKVRNYFFFQATKRINPQLIMQFITSFALVHFPTLLTHTHITFFLKLFICGAMTFKNRRENHSKSALREGEKKTQTKENFTLENYFTPDT